MATRTFTNGGVDNLWTTAGNWDTPPVDNDVVVISAGQTCEYDGDMSNAGTWPNGIDGLTITGTLKLSRTTSGYLKIKAAKTITGAGTFNCGESAALAIPFAVKHTITGGAAWYINGASGLTMTVYAAEPAIKTIMLSGDEAIGQTELSVDTSVVADIWADGDTIRIDDINRSNESEERTIAAGGIAAGAITITAGLTAAKSTGALLHLITRNVKFIGVGAAGYVAQNFASGKLTIAGGQWITANYRILGACTGVAISAGTFSASNFVLYICPSASVSGGVFSGNNQAFNACYLPTITNGIFSGISTVIGGAFSGASISGGTFKGNGFVFNTGTGCAVSGGVFNSNGVAMQAVAGVLVTGGTFSNNTNNLVLASAVVRNVTFSAVTSEIRESIVNLYDVILTNASDNVNYSNLSRESYSDSIDHGQVAGAFKAWTKGGVTSSQAVTVPAGYTSAMQTVLETASSEGFWQKEYTVGAGASINITMNLRKSASMTYLPRCIIFNKAATDPFAGGAGIHTFTMTNSVDTWEAETYTYYNSTANDVTLVIRFQGENATGNMFSALLVEQINVDLTAVIANLAVVDGIVDAILVDTGTDIPASIAAIDTDSVLAATVEGAYSVQDVLKFMAGVLAGKSSGGGTGTITFRDLSDTLNRIVATVDNSGNRLAITKDNS